MDIEKRFEEARTRLLVHQPFFGSVLAQLDIKKNNNRPTMSTDGCYIYYNEEFCAKLIDAELMTIVLHELLHVIYFHCDTKRINSRLHPIWNFAADYVVNLDIEEIAKQNLNFKLPKDALYNKKYKGMATEEVYDLIKKNSIIEELNTGDLIIGIGIDDGDCDGESDGKSKFRMSKDELQKKMEEVKRAILGAYEATKGQGTLPAGLKREIQKLKDAEIHWERLLNRFASEVLSRNDYSYLYPNRRYLYQDVVLPSLRDNSFGEIVVALDTSGSIDVEMITRFASELKKLSNLCEKVTVISADADVHEVVSIYKFDDILKKVKFKGEGGTDFRPVFEKVKELKLQPQLLIYLTDAYGTFPKEAPRYPVLWCVNNDEDVPWGYRIKVSKD